MSDDPFSAAGQTVGERPEVLTESDMDLIETIYGAGGIKATVWCSSCHRVWRVEDLRLHWLEYFDEYGWSCPADGPSTLLCYSRLQAESEPSWPLSPMPGQIVELTALPPEPSPDVFALMTADEHWKARELYVAEAGIGSELADWGFVLGQGLWRHRYPTAAQEQLARTPQLLEELRKSITSESPASDTQDHRS